MVFSFIVVNFMDGDGGMYDGRLNGFLLDDGLNGLGVHKQYIKVS